MGGTVAVGVTEGNYSQQDAGPRGNTISQNPTPRSAVDGQVSGMLCAGSGPSQESAVTSDVAAAQ